MTVASSLAERQSEIAEAVVARDYARRPDLVQRYGPAGREKSLQDARFHVSFLSQAVALDDPKVFVDYIAWVKVVLVSRGVRTEDLESHLHNLAAVAIDVLPPADAHVVARFVTEALLAMPGMADDLPAPLQDAPLSPLAYQYFEALQRVDRASASTMVLAAVDAGASVQDIYLHVFQPAQYELGRLWQTNRITVAEEHYATAATQLVMSQLYPRVFASVKNGHTLVASCVADNLHELGVRMVADFFEMEGWDTYYLGANVPHAAVLDAVAARGADVLAISAALAPQVDDVRRLIAAARARPDTSEVTILVGGHPFNHDEELWRRIGADGFAPDAQTAIALAAKAVGGKAA